MKRRDFLRTCAVAAGVGAVANHFADAGNMVDGIPTGPDVTVHWRNYVCDTSEIDDKWLRAFKATRYDFGLERCRRAKENAGGYFLAPHEGREELIEELEKLIV